MPERKYVIVDDTSAVRFEPTPNRVFNTGGGHWPLLKRRAPQVLIAHAAGGISTKRE